MKDLFNVDFGPFSVDIWRHMDGSLAAQFAVGSYFAHLSKDRLFARKNRGQGIFVKRGPMSFSERNGYAPTLKVRGWRIGILSGGSLP